jgi:hypothetical protein
LNPSREGVQTFPVFHVSRACGREGWFAFKTDLPEALPSLQIFSFPLLLI